MRGKLRRATGWALIVEFLAGVLAVLFIAPELGGPTPGYYHYVDQPPVSFVPLDLPPARFTPGPDAPASCKDTVRRDIPEGDREYAPWLDGDRDGLACESPKTRDPIKRG